MINYTNEELLEQYLSGDESAFDKLYSKTLADTTPPLKNGIFITAKYGRGTRAVCGL